MYYDADDVMYNEVDEVKEDDKCNHGVDYIYWKMIKLMVREKMMKIIKNGDDEDEDAGVD